MANETVFEKKANQYAAGRPSYAPEIIGQAVRDYVPAGGVVADVGSGTGILTRELVLRGIEAYAVEPNARMREKAEEALGGYPNFHSVAASAEATGLAAQSVDAVMAGSALHWFDAALFRQECARILRPGGVVCAMINMRVMDEFTRKQSAICTQHCPAFESLTHGYDKTVRAAEGFFAGGYERFEADFPLTYTKEKFIARSLSSSYALSPEMDGYKAFVAQLRALLDEMFEGDTFTVANKTVMFAGKVE